MNLYPSEFYITQECTQTIAWQKLIRQHEEFSSYNSSVTESNGQDKVL